ncbi:MAG: pyridoxal phosphate-dependent decarboxylase family protein [Thermomicrobiales bacterium]
MTAANPYDESVRALDRVHELAREYVRDLPNRRVGRLLETDELTDAFDEPLPEHSSDPVAAIEDWFKRADPGIVASPGPRFFGFVVGGATPAALAGDWLASAIDQNGGLWPASPASAVTELAVIRWLKELFGLPSAWVGVLTSGATMANLVGLAAARQWAGRQLGFDPAVDGLGGHPPIPVLSSQAIHSSAVKALGNLGLGRSSVRKVAAPGGEVNLAAFEKELEQLDGPVIVIANAGEVNTGQFDKIDAIADLCQLHPGGAWLHVDGAFGLFAAASPGLQYLVAGIERADSVASDGHKWLNVPYDCGFAFVRDESALRATFSAKGPYTAGSAGWDADDFSPDMSRRFRGLAAWCALKAYGRDGYRALVERCVENATAFASWVDETPGLELMNAERVRQSPLNCVCFRFTPAGLEPEATNAFNRAAVAAIQDDGRAFVTGTVWEGKAAIRAAFDNWATTLADVEILESVADDVGAKLHTT